MLQYAFLLLSMIVPTHPVTLSHPAYKFLTENGFNFAFVCCMVTVAN